MVKQWDSSVLMKKLLNRIKFLGFCILLASCNACDSMYFEEDETFKLKYPTSFEPITYTESTVFLSLPENSNKADVFMAFDTATGQVLGRYDFALGKNLYSNYAFLQRNDRVYLNLVNATYGDITELNLVTGKLKRLSANSSEVFDFIIADDLLYYHGGAASRGDKVTWWKYDLNDHAYDTEKLGYCISNSVYRLPQGFINNGSSYIAVSKLYKSGSTVLNLATGNAINIKEEMKLDFNEFSLDSPFNSWNGSSTCFLIFSNTPFCQKLYRVISFEPMVSEEIGTVTEHPRTARIVYEGEKRVIIATECASEKQYFKVYNLETKQLEFEFEKYRDGNYSRARGNIVFKGNTLWWIRRPFNSERLYLAKMDVDTLDQELIEIDEKWQSR